MKTTKKTLKKYQKPKFGKSNETFDKNQTPSGNIMMTPDMVKRSQEMMKNLQERKNTTRVLPEVVITPKDSTDNKKKGGSVKAKKFAALAPPYNKATAADRIAGAKKSKSSKKK
jgi:hypothetical protein